VSPSLLIKVRNQRQVTGDLTGILN
jgi:hypothetical protein